MAENQPLSLADMDSISDALFNLVSKFPELPFKASAKTLQWQNLGEEEGIGLFTQQGAIYLTKYVSGSYVAQFPFRIIYKCTPTSTRARISSQALLEHLSAWLETCSATFKDEHLEIQSIERTSPVFKQDADDSGYEKYTCTLNVKYYYRK